MDENKTVRSIKGTFRVGGERHTRKRLFIINVNTEI